ncbi:UDP-N-acetylmuramoylalanyl-D-glutamate--2,6-diaminopimelate ligase [Pseudoalteromonas carrageenovora]|uniref:UDP-N-acetylmuramoyl-L-alanyl-D-glutamate--2,6-diaminopimelate ligase n=1 Tax=Pseudoalteromonas carrageenovora IAM 12662 TaxID=1314868 RepID=A0A2K4X6C7_PSEVC|nr:UDP-N-acetylmuramoyl-L-alanyl-D-glutamate--2,6-diaminopimelate ligase [Pseudoalteromonas carrageenovora]MBE0382090.1 UDP-N-acetylmuramoyl-L-alanyl-D-glutamate--2,6-diaminopimelate ligase [Pseudoalteromonas carrageenovora IAM 12662]QBJ70822.1 UDP-N-acetylmuramoylalanyl-D-glutamate--2,6-diaminopimelate ligase [Pseudoalteromonas carrageenovora]GEB69907.1 UDP-N-acetylmuramoyl-L-alanyl-D-glutamate--2,6-diaminopimelate ligase [Pseudoalteromonas carrageenovora]SOU39888.1 UDP-N-acetylmuramoyl-L-alan
MRDLKAILKYIDIDAPSQVVKHLRLDSRDVTPGDVFVAIKGHQLDGGQFIDKAIENGATAIIADRLCEFDVSFEPLYLVTELDKKLPELASRFYAQPSHNLDLIGVTGTNGKSTTTAMIAHLAQFCSIDSAIIGTLGYGHPDTLTPLINTTPSTVDLQHILSDLHQQHKKLIAMEVSSHGLVQHRVAQCQFKAAVFTNLSRDHLDYHGDMVSYGDAKLMLFRDFEPQHVVLNQDDGQAEQWLEKYSFNNLVCYGRKNLAPDNVKFVYFSDVEYSNNGISAQLITSWGDVKIKSPLFGEFNLYNLTAALATLLSLGYPLEQLIDGCAHLQPVAGRMQAFSEADKPTCVVDYAHTPEALALALQALQKHVPGGVSCVFGCGGDRDKGKRALMAQAAEQNANKVIITSDNPRSENPDAIIADVAAGLTHPEKAHLEADRATAISYAINNAAAGDVILIAGKGHEDYQIIGDTRIDFCDRRYVQEQLKKAVRGITQ